MMGRSHATTGFLVGAATLPIAPTTGLVENLAWVSALGGMALLPDLDQGGLIVRRRWLIVPVVKVTGSSIARIWGPLTAVPAALVGKLARGHRNGTHDPVVGPLTFATVATVASWWAFTRWLGLALAVGLMFHAVVDKANGVKPPPRPAANIAVSFAGSALLILFGQGPTWLPEAVLFGCLTHIAGDALTVGGIPVPFTWIRGRAARLSLDLFSTNTAREAALAWVASLATFGLLYLNEATVHSTVHAVVALGGSL